MVAVVRGGSRRRGAGTGERDPWLPSCERRFAEVLELLGDGVIVAGRDGRIRHLNEPAERLTGWPAVESIGRDIEQVCRLLDVATEEALAIPLTAVMDTGATVAFVSGALLEARDGTRRRLAGSVMPVCSAQGQFVGAMVVLRAGAGDGAGALEEEACAPIEMTVLRRQIGEDEAVVQEFLRRFVVSARELAGELRSACWRGQPAAAARAARELKEASRALGALRLAAACVEIERASRAGHADRLGALLTRFEQRLAEVERAIERI